MKKPKPSTQLAVATAFGVLQIVCTFDGADDTDPELGPGVAFQVTDTGVHLQREIAETNLGKWIWLPGPDIPGVTTRPAILDTGNLTDTG